MGWFRRAGIALSALAGALGWTTPPEDDVARLARIDELYSGYRREFPEVPEIDATRAVLWLAEHRDVVFVDVRTEEERAVSMIPGAVPAEEIERHPSAYQQRTLIAYCTIGYRSGLWAARERALGLDVTNLSGSLLAWTHADGPLVSGAGPTLTLHVYGATWDLAAKTYRAVW